MGAQAGELRSSSHSREGLVVPGPDLFSCFCVSGGCVKQTSPPHPLLWRDSHVYTCLSLPPRPKGLFSGWGPGLEETESPNLVLSDSGANMPILQMRKLSPKERKGHITQ